MIDSLFERFADDFDAKEDFERQTKDAKFPRSSAASFMQVVGLLFIALGVIGVLTLQVFAGLGCILAGGFMICVAALQQTVFDIRTMLLRQVSDSERSV
ncbi:MAG: hypothetical protein AAGE86_09305 [Pseudomonadota bacterium]